jgi:hypothetical protein
MNIIEEHRSKVRTGENTYSIEVTSLPGGDQPDRLIVSIGGAGPQGQLVADGQLEVASAAAAALGSVLSETLRHHVAISEPGAQRTRARPAGQGRPWSPELDRELERRWIEGESVQEIAVHLERTPGGIRARLPRARATGGVPARAAQPARGRGRARGDVTGWWGSCVRAAAPPGCRQAATSRRACRVPDTRRMRRGEVPRGLSWPGHRTPN